jgi:hypothetical protein
MTTFLRCLLLSTAIILVSASPGLAQNCKRVGTAVTCDDGRTGILAGDAIVWPDGTRSSSTPHPSVRIGHKDSVRVGPGVFVGQGKGSVPLDDPGSPNKRNCAILDGVSYCH